MVNAEVLSGISILETLATGFTAPDWRSIVVG
jgi:hypothetical protein